MKKRKKSRLSLLSIFLLSLILLTLVFIFSRSLKPPAASDEESLSVGDFLTPWLSGFALGRFVLDHLRKCAHFGEYAVLGFELFAFSWSAFGNPLFSIPRKQRRRRNHRCGTLGLLVALTDETLQIFSHRGPSLCDVWLDYAGYLFGISVLLFLSVIAEIAFIRKA